MANTRFKGGTSSERLNYTSVSDADMIQLRHKPGTEEDTDKGISKASLVSCPFGVSETIAATAAKTAALTDSNPDFSLVSGREVVVYFSTANSANSPTLNFAGSGAAPMYYPDGSAVGSWAAGTWMHLKYFSATVGGVLLQRWILLSPGKVVDEVALNNMHSVTSNAVANAINNISSVLVSVTGHLGNMYLCKFGKVVYMSFSSDWTSLASGNNPNIATIPQGYHPIATCGLKEISTTNATLYINENGSVNCYNYGSAITQATNGNYFACWITGD